MESAETTACECAFLWGAHAARALAHAEHCCVHRRRFLRATEPRDALPNRPIASVNFSLHSFVRHSAASPRRVCNTSPSSFPRTKEMQRPSSCSIACSSTVRASCSRSVAHQPSEARTLSISRRLFLLLASSVLMTGCAVLIFSLRVVSKHVLFAVIFALLYTLVANSLQPASMSLDAKSVKPLVANQQLSKGVVRFCLLTSLLLSLMVPWTWILAFTPTPQQQRLLAPHLFVMMTQVLFEIWSYRPCISAVVRVCIPVAFVSYRLVLLYRWVCEAAAVVSNQVHSRVMLLLAVANLAFWSFVLFYILLLKVCPPYFLVQRSPPTSVDAQ